MSSDERIRTLAKDMGIGIDGKTDTELAQTLLGRYRDAGAQIAGRNAQLLELKSALTSLQEDYVTLQKQLEEEHAAAQHGRGTSQQRYAKLQKQLDAADAALEQATQTIAEKQEFISGLDVQLDAARSTLASLEQQVEHEQQERFAGRKVLKDMQAEREKELDYLLGKAKEAGVAVETTMGVHELADMLSARLAEYADAELGVRTAFTDGKVPDAETAGIATLAETVTTNWLTARGKLGELHDDREKRVEELTEKIKTLQSNKGEKERESKLGKLFADVAEKIIGLHYLIKDDTAFAFSVKDFSEEPFSILADISHYIRGQKSALLKCEASFNELKQEIDDLKASHNAEQKRARSWRRTAYASLAGAFAAAASAAYLFFFQPPPHPPPQPPDYTYEIQKLCASEDGIVGRFIAPDACAGKYGSGGTVLKGIRAKVANARQSTYQGLFLTDVLKNVLGEVKQEEARPVRFAAQTPTSRIYIFSADAVVETKLTPLPSTGWYEVTIPEGHGAQKSKRFDVRTFFGDELLQQAPFHLMVNGKLETIRRAENDNVGITLSIAEPGSDLWQFLQDGNTIRYVPPGTVIPDGIKDFQFIRDIDAAELQGVEGKTANAIRLNARAVGKRLEDIFDAACVTIHVDDASYSHANSDGATACRANTNKGKVPYRWSVELFNTYPQLTNEFVEKTHLHTGFLQQEPHAESNHPLNTYPGLIEKLDAAQRAVYDSGKCQHNEHSPGIVKFSVFPDVVDAKYRAATIGDSSLCPELKSAFTKAMTEWAQEWMALYPFGVSFERYFEIGIAEKHGRCYEPSNNSNIEIFIPSHDIGSFKHNHRYHIVNGIVTPEEKKNVDWNHPRTCAPPTIYLPINRGTRLRIEEPPLPVSDKI